MTRVMGNGHADHPRPRTLNSGDGSSGSPEPEEPSPRFSVAVVHQLGQGFFARRSLVKGLGPEGYLRAIERVDLGGAAATAGKGESA